MNTKITSYSRSRSRTPEKSHKHHKNKKHHKKRHDDEEQSSKIPSQQFMIKDEVVSEYEELVPKNIHSQRKYDKPIHSRNNRLQNDNILNENKNREEREQRNPVYSPEKHKHRNELKNKHRYDKRSLSQSDDDENNRHGHHKKHKNKLNKAINLYKPSLPQTSKNIWPKREHSDDQITSQDHDERLINDMKRIRDKRHKNLENGGEPCCWGKPEDDDTNIKMNKVKTEKNSAVEPQDREKPNFKKSGKLTEDTNTFRGVVIKYNEPQEARKPKKRWRLYPFKGEEALPVLHVHRQSAYLLGRDRRIADIPVDHPSCSKQHAVLQFRLVPFERRDGSQGRRIRPYIIDLESANGTFINNIRVEAKRYIELLEKDVLKFGFSKRDYVLLHDSSKGDDLMADEDVI